MPIGLGIGLAITRGGTPGFSLTAPDATWISDAATAQAVFQIDVDTGVVSGDKIWGESSTDNFATVLQTVSAAIGVPDLADFQIDDFAFDPFTPDGTYYVRFWVSNSADVAISPKSDVISLAISSAFSPSDFGADLMLWLEADDLSTLFQDVAGSSAVTTDGHTVGTWNDKSGDNFHLTAPADDTTRPTYNTAGGLHWVTFDGSNDLLRRTADLGMYAAGACSVFVAVKGNPAADACLVGSGSSASGTPRYTPIQADASTAANASAIIRNDAFSEFQGSNVDIQVGAFDNTDNVYGIVDSGSDLTPYLDGVGGTPDGYTRSGTITLNRFTLGALIRNTTASWFNGLVYAVVIVNRVLTSGEIADLTTYLGAKQGRSI